MSMDLDEMLKEAPALSLEMPTVSEAAGTAPAQVTAEEEAEVQVTLTEEERKMVNEFATQIDISNAQQVTQFGAASQKKIADFSEAALNSVKTKDLGEVGQMLTNMVVQLKEFEEGEETKGFLGMFKKKFLPNYDLLMSMAPALLVTFISVIVNLVCLIDHETHNQQFLL